MTEKEEFELVPLSPLRRLEKRIDELESSPGANTKEFLSEVVDIIKMNQQLVDQLAKADDALRIEISKLPAKIDNLVENLNELLSFIKASATEEVAAPAAAGLKPLGDKLDKLVEANKKLVENNQEMLSALETISEKLKRPMPPPRFLPLRK